MHGLKDYIPIIFQGGSYGSTLHYILNNISFDNATPLPFGMNGNSHNFKYNSVLLNKNLAYEINHCTNSKFIKYHPKTTKEQSLPIEITRIVSNVDKAILIYPSPNHRLLVINNYYLKVWKNWFEGDIIGGDAEEKKIFTDNLYLNWDIPLNTPFVNIPRWIQREFISLYLFMAWNSQYEWNLLDHYSHPKLHVITTHDFLYNFESTIRSTALMCGINTDNIDNMQIVHNKMMLLQQNLDSDDIYNNIINNFINNTDYKFGKLSIVDEAWIQYELRNIGVEIQCNNLNVFPNTVADLKKITYST
jgi:hypothetical protein